MSGAAPRLVPRPDRWRCGKEVTRRSYPLPHESFFGSTDNGATQHDSVRREKKAKPRKRGKAEHNRTAQSTVRPDTQALRAVPANRGEPQGWGSGTSKQHARDYVVLGSTPTAKHSRSTSELSSCRCVSDMRPTRANSCLLFTSSDRSTLAASKKAYSKRSQQCGKICTSFADAGLARFVPSRNTSLPPTS